MPRIVFLALALIALPVLDLALLWRLGATRGGAQALGLALLGAIAGVVLCRASRPFSPPWLAGLLLGVPGPLSDALGLLLLVPGVRRHLAAWLLRGVAFRVMGPGGPFARGPTVNSSQAGDAPAPPGQGPGPRPEDGPVRDVDYRMVAEQPPAAGGEKAS